MSRLKQSSSLVKRCQTVAMVAAMVLGPAFVSAGPITTIKSLSPYYNSTVILIEWDSPVTGGCTTSAFAVTSGTALGREELNAFLLSALLSQRQVEVTFGGGCDGSANWVQTIRLIRS